MSNEYKTLTAQVATSTLLDGFAPVKIKEIEGKFEPIQKFQRRYCLQLKKHAESLKAYDQWKAASDSLDRSRLHVEQIDGEFVLQHEPGIDTSLAAEQFGLSSFDGPDMYFGALNVAGVDQEGHLHALADTRRQGAQFISD